MTQQLLSASPLGIVEHFFPKVILEANANPHPEGGLKLNCERKVVPGSTDQDPWTVVIEVKLDSLDGKKPAVYKGCIQACGRFKAREGFPKEKVQGLMEVTAATILYGCCREMLATVSGRGPHGVLALPSVTFTQTTNDASEVKAIPSRKSKTPKKKATRQKSKHAAKN